MHVMERYLPQKRDTRRVRLEGVRDAACPLSTRGQPAAEASRPAKPPLRARGARAVADLRTRLRWSLGRPAGFESAMVTAIADDWPSHGEVEER